MGKLVSTAAIAAASTTAATARAGTFFTGTGFVYRKSTPLELGSIKGLNSRLCSVAHLDEAKAARAARFTIGHHLCTSDRTILSEESSEVVRRRAERKIAYVQILAHESSSAAGAADCVTLTNRSSLTKAVKEPWREMRLLTALGRALPK